MKNIYSKIWQLARPYYERGRPMDIAHIEWMMAEAESVCKKESIDDTLLLPLVILHDVGYANVPKDNPFNLDLRKTHMAEGEKIAKTILEEMKYPLDKSEKIAHYVSIHDSWAFGNHKAYNEDIVLGVFNDLDFIWMAAPQGFPSLMKILNKNKAEMIEYIEKSEKIINRPFATKTTKELYERYIQELKE